MVTPASQDPERDSKGRFKPGNKAAKGGHGGGRRTQAIQRRIIKQMEEQFSVEDLREILEEQKRRAKEGEWRAVKFIFEYMVGRPVQRVAKEGSGESNLERLLDQLADITGGVPEKSLEYILEKVIHAFKHG